MIFMVVPATNQLSLFATPIIVVPDDMNRLEQDGDEKETQY